MITTQRLIKKYPNRRLYDTLTSAYITVADVKRLIVANEVIKVVDAKTDDDLTRSIFLQIILEEEASGSPLFSEVMLAQMIRFYGHAMQGLMGTYLEKNLQSFLDIQNRFSEQTKGFYDAPGAGAAGANPMAAGMPSVMPSPEQWTQIMATQAPMMQGVMSNYVDQSKNLFAQMQEQMQKQTQGLWPGFGFGAPSAAPTPAGTKPDSSPKSTRSTKK
jgi:polyhydroxyalkanoate synthesis repressor PhaR